MAKIKTRLSSWITGSVLAGIVLLVVLGLVMTFWPRTGFGYQESMDAEASLEKYPPVIPIETNFPAPELSLTDLEGETVSLSEYRGNVILVNIWAIWCTPCRAELPVLQEFYLAHQDQGFVVIGIESGDEIEDILYHVNLFKLSFPNWQDPDEEASRAFSVLSIPSSFVIDQSGRVRLTWTGAANLETLERYLTPLLEK